MLSIAVEKVKDDLLLPQVYFSSLAGGLFDGSLAVTVEFGKDRRIGTDALLAAVRSVKHSRVVRLLGSYKACDESELLDFSHTLREYGLTVIGHLDGLSWRSWMGELSWRIVERDEDDWRMFAANEVHFTPKKRDKLVPPPLGELNAKSAWLYLKPKDFGREPDTYEVLAFMERNPGWRVLHSPAKIFRSIITIKEE